MAPWKEVEVFETKDIECHTLAAGFSEESFTRIAKLQELFPLVELRLSQDEIRSYLDDQRVVHMFLRRVTDVRGGGEDIGYIVAVPHDAIVDEFRSQDPLMEKDSGRYYIDQLFLVPDEREGLTFLVLVEGMMDELVRRQIHRISSHILACDGLQTVIARAFRRRLTLRRRDVLLPMYPGLAFDYMEANCCL